MLKEFILFFTLGLCLGLDILLSSLRKNAYTHWFLGISWGNPIFSISFSLLEHSNILYCAKKQPKPQILHGLHSHSSYLSLFPQSNSPYPHVTFVSQSTLKLISIPLTSLKLLLLRFLVTTTLLNPMDIFSPYHS